MLTTRDLDIARLVHLCDRMFERQCLSRRWLYDPRRTNRWSLLVIQWKRERFQAELPPTRKTRA